MKRALALVGCCLAACSVEGHLREPELSTERMLEQPRADPYELIPGSSGRPVMRTPPAGTVARGARAEARPPTSLALLGRGRQKHDVHCAPCHGVKGDGDTPVAAQMVLAKPGSLHTPRIREMSDEAMYAVVRDGVGLMPALDVELTAKDRWAVVAYVRALELSQRAPVSALPPALAEALYRSAP